MLLTYYEKFELQENLRLQFFHTIFIRTILAKKDWLKEVWGKYFFNLTSKNKLFDQEIKDKTF